MQAENFNFDNKTQNDINTYFIKVFNYIDLPGDLDLITQIPVNRPIIGTDQLDRPFGYYQDKAKN